MPIQIICQAIRPCGVRSASWAEIRRSLRNLMMMWALRQLRECGEGCDGRVPWLSVAPSSGHTGTIDHCGKTKRVRRNKFLHSVTCRWSAGPIPASEPRVRLDASGPCTDLAIGGRVRSRTLVCGRFLVACIKARQAWRSLECVWDLVPQRETNFCDLRC